MNQLLLKSYGVILVITSAHYIAGMNSSLLLVILAATIETLRLAGMFGHIYKKAIFNPLFWSLFSIVTLMIALLVVMNDYQILRLSDELFRRSGRNALLASQLDYLML